MIRLPLNREKANALLDELDMLLAMLTDDHDPSEGRDNHDRVMILSDIYDELAERAGRYSVVADAFRQAVRR